MKTIILYVWIETGNPFGVFSDKNQSELALAAAADDIKTTIDNLRADLYYYELPLNKLVLTEQNVILDY